MKPSFMEEITKIRSRICTKDRQGSQGSQAPSQTSTSEKPTSTSSGPRELPSQYPSMSNKETVAQLVSSLADLGMEEDESESTDDDMMQVTSSYTVTACQLDDLPEDEDV